MQPVCKGEYPGWSFEPGFFQTLLFYEGVGGHGPLRQWLAEAPEVLRVNLEASPGGSPLGKQGLKQAPPA